MDLQLVVLFGLTFVINLIGSLAYSVRIAGVRTLRIAVSLSLFNVLLLVSRTANSFQAPLLAKRVESSLGERSGGALADFRWLIVAASLATVVGALLTPTFQRLFTRAVSRFAVDRSVARLLLRLFSPAGVAVVRDSVALPSIDSVAVSAGRPRLPTRIVLINVLATAVWTVGVLASLYAAHLNPSLRVTSSNLSGIVNGVATILLFVVVDPYLSLVTDDVLQGKASESFFRRCVVWMLGSRLLGTLLAQALLVSAAALIAWLAEKI
jgi:Alternate to MurJ